MRPHSLRWRRPTRLARTRGRSVAATPTRSLVGADNCARRDSMTACTFGPTTWEHRRRSSPRARFRPERGDCPRFPGTDAQRPAQQARDLQAPSPGALLHPGRASQLDLAEAPQDQQPIDRQAMGDAGQAPLVALGCHQEWGPRRGAKQEVQNLQGLPVAPMKIVGYKEDRFTGGEDGACGRFNRCRRCSAAETGSGGVEADARSNSGKSGAIARAGYAPADLVAAPGQPSAARSPTARRPLLLRQHRSGPSR